MRRKVLLLIFVLSLSFLFKIDVNATIVRVEDIKPGTYVIGKYMYTRDANQENNYDGILRTQTIMLASQTLDGDLDDMIIYQKNVLGQWKNGMTGEDIEVPRYFEIENRNLRDMPPTPELNCIWEYAIPENKIALCEAGAFLGDELIDSENENYGIEYYILQDSDGNFIEGDARFTEGIFTNGSMTKELVPAVTNLYGSYDSAKFYQVVSRIYYEDTNLDGTKSKIYSEYSNISSNGIKNKLHLSESLGLNAKLTSVGMNVEDDRPYDVTFYNVEFSLSNIDTSKYYVRRYDVYALNVGNNPYLYENMTAMRNLAGSNETFMMLYLDNSVSEKYTTPHYINLTMHWNGKSYLVASKYRSTVTDGIDQTIYDVSGEKAYSMKFDKLNETLNNSSSKNYYVAKVKLCDRVDQYSCYEVYTFPTNAFKKNQVDFNLDDGTNYYSQNVSEGGTATRPESPTKEGYVFVNWLLDGEEYDFSTPVTSDITLVANFRPLNTYTVTFNPNPGYYSDGASLKLQLVKEGDKIDAQNLPEPKRYGYTFAGWTLNGEDFDENTIINSNITLNSKWVQKDYAIIGVRVDPFSPDLRLKVYEEDQEISFKEIKYNDVVICSSIYPVININEVSNGQNLTIVLPGGTEVTGALTINLSEEE